MVVLSAVLLFQLSASPQPFDSVGTRSSASTIGIAFPVFHPAVSPALKPEKPAAKHIRLFPNEASEEKWIALSVATHGAAVFDPWSTRRAISSGDVETNPFIRPFADSSAVYGALQLTPALLDFISRRMMRSHNQFIRQHWWMPQTVAIGISISAGAHNRHAEP